MFRLQGLWSVYRGPSGRVQFSIPFLKPGISLPAAFLGLSVDPDPSSKDPYKP